MFRGQSNVNKCLLINTMCLSYLFPLNILSNGPYQLPPSDEEIQSTENDEVKLKTVLIIAKYN